jgi:hypothetical protein
MILLVHLLEHLGVRSGAAIAIVVAGKNFRARGREDGGRARP